MQEKVTGNEKCTEFRCQGILAFLKSMAGSKMEMETIILVIKCSIHKRKIWFNSIMEVRERRRGRFKSLS